MFRDEAFREVVGVDPTIAKAALKTRPYSTAGTEPRRYQPMPAAERAEIAQAVGDLVAKFDDDFRQCVVGDYDPCTVCITVPEGSLEGGSSAFVAHFPVFAPPGGIMEVVDAIHMAVWRIKTGFLNERRTNALNLLWELASVLPETELDELTAALGFAVRAHVTAADEAARREWGSNSAGESGAQMLVGAGLDQRTARELAQEHSMRAVVRALCEADERARAKRLEGGCGEYVLRRLRGLADVKPGAAAAGGNGVAKRTAWRAPLAGRGGAAARTPHRAPVAGRKGGTA